MYYAARQQHLEWLKEELAKKEDELASLQTHLLDLQGSITYYKSVIEQLSPTASDSDLSLSRNSQPEDTSSSKSRQPSKNLLPEGKEKLCENDDLEEEIEFEFEAEGENKRLPKDMLRPQLRGKTLGDIAEMYLKDAKGKELNSDDLAKLIFQPASEKEFQRAKNSLSTELRRGAKEERWKKNGRGMFSANPDSF